MLVLMMLFITPILSYTTYMPERDSFDLSLAFMDAQDPNTEAFGMIFQSFVEK